MRPFTRPIVLAALCASCAKSSAPTAAPSVRPALPSDVHALASLDRNAAPDDLTSIREVVGGAEIVGLGETNHGSNSFQDAEGRLVGSLVRDLGFRAVGFELGDDLVSEATACIDTDAIVRRWGSFAGEGNARTVEWICNWNRTHPSDPVHLFGTDIWLGPEDVRAITAWAKATLEPQDADSGAEGLRSCFGATAASGWRIQMGEERLPPITIASNSACIDALDRIAKLAAQRRAPLEIDMRLARLRGHQGFYSTLHELSSRYGARDESQATITLRLREMRFPGNRAVVIAHASHVAYRTSALANNPFVSFGERLREQVGDRYRAIAISGFDVAVSRVQGKNEYRHEEPNSVERLVHELTIPFAFVDLRGRTRSSLVEHGATYHVGFDELIPRDHFDGVVVVDAAGGNPSAR